MMTNIEISSPDKLIFPKDKIKKIDVINYYNEIADLMLPYVRKRLLSVIRCHDGIHGKCFFKKHPSNDKKMVKVRMIKGEEYFYIEDKFQLLYQVQMGTIEFHTWASCVPKINQPNMMVFDLDPDEKLSLKKLRDSVMKLKSILDELKLPAYLKTSGGKGYHIVVPFIQGKTYEKFYELSRQISEYAQNKWNTEFTTNIRKNERKGKIFIDYLRNNKGATCVAPYSIRARDNAPISMPIKWEDLYNIKPNEVTIKNYKKYLNNAWNDFEMKI